MADWQTGRADESYLIPRWLFLRALGAIFFSAFYSLAFQVQGLIGSHGILPVADYLHEVAASAGASRLWYVPSLFWLNASNSALAAGVAAGIVCSVLVVVNICPRVSVACATLLFLAFVATLQDFSSYQSDGMLLEAGLISVFFAPGGFRPGLAAADPPSRISLFMLRWEWFRIYFESGLVKLMSGDHHWRDFTAMDDYYQNGPLPAWPGWYVQHLPHWYHAGTVALTLVVELAIVWAVFLPRRARFACCAVVTALQIGIIATANYAFLNYLVLALGILLLDDDTVRWIRERVPGAVPLPLSAPERPPRGRPVGAWRVVQAVVLGWVFYATVWAFLAPASRDRLALPARALASFRVANGYGLFATMTDARYEIEFQGSRDGETWTPYPFRYKPQSLMERPGIYAPYQPRFEWNLWFASLAPWQDSPWVVAAQERLAEGSPDVLALFRSDPFGGRPPAYVRTVLWQYWFTDVATKRATGAWWRRKQLGLFGGVVSRDSTGRMTFSPAAPSNSAPP